MSSQIAETRVRPTLNDADGADVLEVGRLRVHWGCQCEVDERADTLDQGLK